MNYPHYHRHQGQTFLKIQFVTTFSQDNLQMSKIGTTFILFHIEQQSTFRLASPTLFLVYCMHGLIAWSIGKYSYCND